MTSVRQTEYQHNTRQQVVLYLEAAAEIVAEIELDGDLRVPAFLKACDLLSAKQVFYEPLSPVAIPRLNAH